MKRIPGIALILLLLFACTPTDSPNTLYEELSVNQQDLVDTVLDEFKRHHLFFLPEHSEVLTLTAATARADAEPGEGASEDGHDHSTADGSYLDEHLDIKVFRATPDKNGNYHTPTIQLTPDRIYTYEEMYTVEITDQQITVTATKATDDNPERVKSTPESEFVNDLAERVNGKVTGPGLISL